VEDVAPLSRRATDVATGPEIVRFIVDAENAVQFVQTEDPTRISDAMRWPQVMNADIVSVVPEQQRTELQRLLSEVRAGRTPAAWLFPSALHKGEMRLLHALPVRSHPNWVALTVLAIPAEIDISIDDVEDRRESGRDRK
jgi:hypothetical protein